MIKETKQLPKIKALHIGKYFTPFNGGIENFTRDLVTCDEYSRKVSSAVLAHHHISGRASDSETLQQVLVRRVRRQGVLLYTPICLAFGVELTKLIKAFKPDVLHIHMPNASAFYSLFCSEAKKIPWVVHWHSDVLGASPDWRVKYAYNIYSIFERKLLDRAQAIIATSPNYLADSLPLKAHIEKCHVIPLGIKNLAELDTLRIKPEECKDLSLLIIGRLTYYKGHNLLLQALSKLSNTRLTIIGDGELRQKLLEDIKRMGLGDRVAVLGSVSNDVLSRELNRCDLLCLPSIEKTEAFGMVLLEAMRAGKPSLVSDVAGSGMSWVVQNNVTGYVVRNNSVDHLVDCLSLASQNKKLLKLMGNSAKKRFKTEFTIEAVAKSVLAVYNRLL